MNLKQMRMEIPLWEKEFLSVDEASCLFNLNSSIIRGLAFLAKNNKDDLPCIFINGSEKPLINRRLAIEYFSKASLEKKKYKIQSLKEIMAEMEKPQPKVRRGRPRKVIL